MKHRDSDGTASALRNEQGVALLISLLALSIFSALGFYMAFNGVTEVRISDNYESHVQAREAALAGISHARELIRGIDHNLLLTGPDGTYNNSPSYLTTARAVAFRNPLAWAQARAVNIFNPATLVAGFADDGVISTGKAGSANGTSLIPIAGIVQTAPNPYGSGTVVTSRYFAKIADNNGEATELAGDAADNPFTDGDGIIIVRSMGIARTLQENSGGLTRANSVVVYETRFRRSTTWSMDSPMIVVGDTVVPSAPNMFDGNSFDINGGANNYGVGTIDPNPGVGAPVDDVIKAQLSKNQENNIRGLGGTPSVEDITLSLTSPDDLLLRDPNYLYTFATSIIRSAADTVYTGNQSWSGGSAPDIGYFDPSKPITDSTQRPKIIYVDGDLNVTGNVEGGGILVVRGKLSGGGRFVYNGLILVLGGGDVDMSGWNIGLNGGMFVANLQGAAPSASFGTPKLTIAGNSNILINANAIKMGMELIPVNTLSTREVTSSIEP